MEQDINKIIKKGYVSRPTIDHFPELKLEDLLCKYGPEGLYDIANLLTKRADEDVSDAING